ncbi:MAG: TIM barrel protein, partial [Spirochaetaceae bacterium]|nr:TIM barrel protein [Spirochaetaceae bacterium]
MKTALEVESFFETYYKETGQYPSLEIPYEWDSLMLEYLPSIKGRVLSGHNPCPGDGDFLPNLGSRDSSVIRASLDSIVTSAETVVSFGGDILILHAGYLQDGPLITHNIVQNRKKGMCKPGYEESADYSLHMKAAIGNLNEAAAACMDMGVRLAVENLLPRFNYLFQMPEDFLFMVQEIENIFICVDVGHLWVSSLVHDYDYLQALILLISTERVVSAHIHDNRSINGNNPHYNDDHG